MKGLFDSRREHDACGVGFVAYLDGQARHEVMQTALTAMARMAHRGGGDGKSGDGAGMLFPLPKAFFLRQWPQLAQCKSLWAVGQFFLPQSAPLRQQVLQSLHQCLNAFGLTVADGRDVPVNAGILAQAALESMPIMQQLLVLPAAASPAATDAEAFERILFLARRTAENTIWASLKQRGIDPRAFYVVSLSCRSIIYKGMLPGARIGEFYSDVLEPDCAAPFAVFHERFSTNTMPAWPLAQPFRLVAHNGEINTLRGNVAHMQARETLLHSDLLGKDLRAALPIITDFISDSGMFDNVLELLVRGGKSLTHALMMMVPEPFGSAFVMGDNKRAFYEFHASLLEPWDGPTALVFTDGYRRVGALLDRNGLRPCRYSVSRDGLVVLGSESGIADLPEESIIQRGQLRPRRMIMADVQRHHLAPDAELKGQVIRAQPYRRWLQQYAIRLENLHSNAALQSPLPPLPQRQASAGCDAAWIERVLIPMANSAQEPVESMGNDLPLACLDASAQPLFRYFKQHFAQVTNPPVDPYREQLSMSLMGFAGREGNMLETKPESCATLRLPHPFLTATDMQCLRASEKPEVRAITLDATFPAKGGGAALAAALEEMFNAAADAVKQGATLLIISDTAATAQRAPIPALLATAGLHHALMRRRLRHACGIIVECGEACEVMHMAQLIGYGASAIYPHTALDTLHTLALEGRLATHKPHEAQEAYIAALKKGLLKAFARLGIATLRSFRGSQPFEAVGLSQQVIDTYFTGTPSSINGIGLDLLAQEAAARHARAFTKTAESKEKSSPCHLWSKPAIRALHEAVRTKNIEAYQRFAATSDVQEQPFTLRSLLGFAPTKAIPLVEVEPAQAILKRFVGAAISFGAISKEAHETIAAACNGLGARSNCGEGGEDPQRSQTTAQGYDVRSRIRQVASGRFGVTARYLLDAEEIQIKVAQGAKPGEGGQLPAYKVTAEIARARGTLSGVSLISPPPHHDIYSIEDLAQLIYDFKRLNPKAKISVKLVAESGVGTIAVGVAKAGAHSVLISGHDGGTGASPHSAINYVGLPWELGLAETQQALVASGLRSSIAVQTDGQLRTGRDVVIAALLGAEEFGFGTALMVAMGCVLCRKCMKGRCPVGIATQDAALRCKFAGTVAQVQAYLRFVAEDVRQHMAALGCRTMNELIGHTELLQQVPTASTKAATVDLSRLLHKPAGLHTPHCLHQKLESPNTPLEQALFTAAQPLLQGDTSPIAYTGSIHNTDRSAVSRLSGALLQHYAQGLPQHSVHLRLRGQAGQSCGAFLAAGITLEVQGAANDYVGKGLSGGIIIVKPDAKARFVAADQAIMGNVALYGATSGQVYCCGQAGERFAVRNSGASAVVEGVGDHACEYMTGGTVVVLGSTGYNFAAGMSGGIAFAYDVDEHFQNRCNIESVDLESVWQEEDRRLLRHLLEQHVLYTGSPKAATLLDNWDAALPLFVKVMPLDYKKVLQKHDEAASHASETVAATEEVFHDTGEADHA
ncbi:MAG: glutamate synthase large subunit [Desulfovibrionaceae bacterium]|nr:glutamate synthase large subunit [Desulfovibrionaceae bacterium]